MNKIEADNVIDILCMADSSCEFCSATLVRVFIKRNPEHKKLGEDKYYEKFHKTLEEMGEW